MKKLLVILAVVVVVVGIYLTTRSSEQNQGVIKVGAVGILSGEYATVGQNIANGINLAKEEWNREHPELQFDVVLEDDGFDAKKGVSAYQKLINIDKVEAILNTSSPTINAIYDDVTKKDFPVIQFGNQSIDPTDDNVIQVTAGNRPLELALGKFLKEKYPSGVAAYYGGDATFVKFFEDLKEGYGGGLDEYVLNQSGEGPREIATKIAAKNYTVVVVIASPTDGAKLVNELQKISQKPVVFAFDANMQSGVQDYERILGDINRLNGSYVMGIVTNKSATFAENYKNRFGNEPGFWADYGYDGFMTLARAYHENEGKWISNVKKSNFSGASGTITFDDTGVLIPTFEPYQLQNGDFIPVK